MDTVSEINGHYYYIKTSMTAVRGTTYWVTHPNGLMEEGSYTFDDQGRMVNPPEDALTEPVSTFALTGETMSKTYDCVYASGKLMRQTLTVTIGDSTTTYAMDFFYDASGMPFAVKYNGDLCDYITNLQGDVMSIVDAQGEVVAEYEYDPYGNILAATGPLADVNPLRYRGYVYDSETDFYYLQSRYYDPEIARFLNADSYASTGQGVLGNNMFAYCNNNPIIATDPTGKHSYSYDLVGNQAMEYGAADSRFYIVHIPSPEIVDWDAISKWVESSSGQRVKRVIKKGASGALAGAVLGAVGGIPLAVPTCGMSVISGAFIGAINGFAIGILEGIAEEIIDWMWP